jgi:hypothetical protein
MPAFGFYRYPEQTRVANVSPVMLDFDLVRAQQRLVVEKKDLRPGESPDRGRSATDLPAIPKPRHLALVACRRQSQAALGAERAIGAQCQ